MTHLISVVKQTGEVLEFFAGGEGAPTYSLDHPIAIYPVEPEDLIDGHITRGQRYNDQTGRVEETVLSINLKCETFLKQSDWLVTRHRDQRDLGIETSLTQDDYLNVLRQRQQWREMIE